jgi:1-acyl-sn-glycerol-3-phosphate acyltransferase
VSALASLLSWASGLAVFSLILVLVFSGEALSGPRGYDAAAKLLCRRLVRCFRMRVQVEGLEALERGAAYIFIANHVNILDGFLLYGHLPWLFRALELASHFSWPVYGLFLRIFGNIPVDPSDPSLTARGLRRARRALRNGTSILVLPEGHRTRSGRLGSFGRGAFLLAAQSGAVLVPVVMHGAFRVMRTGSWRISPGKVRLIVGEPIRPQEYQALGTNGLAALARGRMHSLLGEKEASAGRP